MTANKNNMAWLAIWLATKDWLHERSLSICGVLALASILAPLLILHGVHNGVVQRLRENLMRDPGVLVIVPQGSRGAGFEEEFLTEIASAPGVAYVIGRTRNVASELQVASETGRRQVITLEATSKGDPIFEKFGAPLPQAAKDNLQIALTYQAASKLEAKAGQTLTASLGRRSSSGKFESIQLELTIISVLPPEASNLDAGFISMPFLLAIQDFRDGISAPLLNYQGEMEPPQDRYYEGFRAYAVNMDDVENLEKWFLSRNVPVNTRSRDIANIKKIDSTLGAVIGLIAGAGCAGFLAFMASTSLAAVRRKWKEIGMLRLTGFSKLSLRVFPLTQVLLTGVCGCLLAFLLYGGVAFSIDALFAEETGGEAICVISWGAMGIIFLGVQLLALLAGGWAARKAASVSPVTVIREG